MMFYEIETIECVPAMVSIYIRTYVQQQLMQMHTLPYGTMQNQDQVMSPYSMSLETT